MENMYKTRIEQMRFQMEEIVKIQKEDIFQKQNEQKKHEEMKYQEEKKYQEVNQKIMEAYKMLSYQPNSYDEWVYKLTQLSKESNHSGILPFLNAIKPPAQISSIIISEYLR